jgi:hypothetical protein
MQRSIILIQNHRDIMLEIKYLFQKRKKVLFSFKTADRFSALISLRSSGLQLCQGRTPTLYQDSTLIMKPSRLVGSLGSPSSHPTHSCFVEKLDQILEINLLCITTRCKALVYETKGLIG